MAARGGHFPLEELRKPVKEQDAKRTTSSLHVSSQNGVATQRPNQTPQKSSDLTWHRRIQPDAGAAGRRTTAVTDIFIIVKSRVSCFNVEQFGLSPPGKIRSTTKSTRVSCHVLTTANGLNLRSSDVEC